MKISIDQSVAPFAVVLTAFAVLVAIRVSSYVLPERYYFTVSSVFKAGPQTMLAGSGMGVDEMCAILDRYRVRPDDVGLVYVDTCAELRQTVSSANWGVGLSAAQSDALYDRWRQRLADIERAFTDALAERTSVAGTSANLGDPPFSPRELVGRAVALTESSPSVTEEIGAAIRDLADKGSPPASAPERGPSFASHAVRIPTSRANAIVDAAAQAGREALKGETFGTLAKHPTRNEFNAILRKAASPDDFVYAISAFYAQYADGTAERAVVSALEREGVSTSSATEAIAGAKASIVLANLPTYAASASIRLAIIFATVFVAAFVLLGRFDIAAFAFGGALAGLLLVWPVVALWDVVVLENSPFRALRGWFLAIYAVYVAAIYFTAKVAAQLASKLRVRLGTSTSDGEALVPRGVVDVPVHEMVKGAGVALCLNTFAFGAGLLLPGLGT